MIGKNTAKSRILSRTLQEVSTMMAEVNSQILKLETGNTASVDIPYVIDLLKQTAEKIEDEALPAKEEEIKDALPVPNDFKHVIELAMEIRLTSNKNRTKLLMDELKFGKTYWGKLDEFWKLFDSYLLLKIDLDLCKLKKDILSAKKLKENYDIDMPDYIR